MYTKRSASFGLNTNVSLDPSASSNSNAKSNQSINNNITIQTVPATTSTKEKSDSTETTAIDTPASALPPAEDYPAVYPAVYPTVLTSSVQERSATLSTDTDSDDVKTLLLEIYEAILLTQNKQLLANILSKNSIIISKSDLERVIQAKIGCSCSISVDADAGCGCCAKLTGVYKIDQIKVDYNDQTLDFKTAFNSAYNELTSTYRLSLKYVVS